jgi:hypothetical protein
LLSSSSYVPLNVAALQTANRIQFIGYCLGQTPSNMILTRFKPHVYLPMLMAVWGAIAVALAGCKTFGALVGVRALLGFLEAGFAPGVLFL